MICNARTDYLRKMLDDAKRDLAEFEAWKRDKPPGTWIHRSSGAWAKETIRNITTELKRRGVSVD